MSLTAAAIIFITGFSVGLLLAAHHRYLEIERLKTQARAYRLQAVALKDLCRRLDRVSQLQPLTIHREPTLLLIPSNQAVSQPQVDLPDEKG